MAVESEQPETEFATPSSEARDSGSTSPVHKSASALPSERDVAPSPGSDPAAIAAAGNPLAAPPIDAHPIATPSAQIAELHPPRFLGPNVRRGNRDSLVRQNERSEQEYLERIEDDADLQDRIRRGMLVQVPASSALTVNPSLPEDRRYCRPWTADFLTILSRNHAAQFHKPLIVSSAVRTVEYQKRLMRTNHNAADAEGDIVSPHLTGATIDIAKSGLSRRELEWMRGQLFAYQSAGVIDVEEEFRQRCFHITVYKSFAAGSREDKSPTSTGASTLSSAGSSGIATK
jgi:hypothetical protein